MLRKSFNFILLILTVILLSSCESKGQNEFLPDQCKTYNEFINRSSKEFYQVLKANDIEVSNRNYFDVVANTKKLIIDTTEYSGDFSLSGIECFQYLNSIELSGPAINDISPLSQLTRVEDVKILNTRVNSLDSLSNMAKITQLTVNQTRTLQKLSGIETLTRLEKVNLAGNSISDIANIEGLPNIKELILNDNELTSIDILQTLPQLTILHVANNKIDFNESESFDGFKTLQVLNLRKNQICSTKALSSFEGLISLDLTQNNLNNHLQASDCTNTNVDFTFLGNMNQITILIADENKLTSIDSIKDVNVGSLTHLSLKTNEMTSIDPIIQNASLANSLTNLYLSTNKVQAVANIHALNHLSYLDLDTNELTSIDDIFLLENLNELYLSKNKIMALPSLTGKLPHLTTIDLSYNELTSVTGFKENNSIVNVDFSFNKINTIIDSFTNMSALSNLNLVSDLTVDLERLNVLNRIENSFINLPSLNVTNNVLKFKFYTNNLEIINSFKSLPQVMEVDFNKISLNNIDEASLALENVTRVNVSENSLTHIKWTNNLPKLNELIADDNEINLQGFVPTHFDQLTNLSLLHNYITDTTALSYLTNIEMLNLSENAIANTTFLNKNAKLTTLNLSNNGLTDVSGIKDLPLLEELNIQNNNITLLNGITNCPNLTTLDFSINPITGIDGLSNIGITSIDLTPYSISHITSTSLKANKFKILDLSNKKLTDFSFIRNLTYLDQFSLNNVVTTSSLDLTPFSGLTNLKFLELNDNKINNIDALQNLTNLEILRLLNNQITSNKLSTDPTKYVIDNFKNLKELILNGNNITELNGLNNCTNLENLGLETQNVTVIRNALKDVNRLQSINYNNTYNPILFFMFSQVTVIDNSFNATTFDELIFTQGFGSNVTIEKSFINTKTVDLGFTSFTNSNIDFINDLVNLESISLINNSTITELKNIDQLPQLKSVNLLNSTVTSIVNSFNNCTKLTEFTLNDNTPSLTNSLNSLIALKGQINHMNISQSLMNLKTIELLNINNGTLNYVRSLSKLETLIIKDSMFSQFSLDVTGLSNLKIVDLSSSTFSSIQNSFNNSSSITSLLLGNMNVINNSFNGLSNLKLPSNTLTIKLMSSSGYISDSFNNSIGFTSLIINHQALSILNSFNETAITTLQFSNPGNVKQLSGFNNTKLENFSISGFTTLTSISGFANAKIKTIQLKATTMDLPNINQSMLESIRLESITISTLELSKLVNNSPALKELHLINTASSLSWLNVGTLNQLNVINVNWASDYAQVLAKKTTTNVLDVDNLSTEDLRSALMNEITSNSSYYRDLVGIVEPNYSGDPTNDQTLKNKVVTYLLTRYRLI